LKHLVVQYEFEQKKRIPSYLFSLSVGDLEERIVGYRTSVVAENGSNTLKAA
jgi:aminopeptidase N